MEKKTEQLSLKITPDLHKRLKAEAKKLKRSKNFLASEYINDGLTRAGRPGPKED